MNNVYEYYQKASEYVRKNYLGEFEYFRDLKIKNLEQFSEKEFLGEFAWVVFTSGFKVARVESKWEELEKAFNGFDPNKINEKSVRSAMQIINHEGKCMAVLKCAKLINKNGFKEFKKKHLTNEDSMEKLPFIGPVTKYLLARNLGMDKVKPDRWIVRISRNFKFHDHEEMCKKISEKTGDKIGLIDYVLWRYASDTKKTE
jgi:hypothetical protein